MKTCIKCNIESGVENFYKGKNSCKNCYRIKNKSYYNVNKELLCGKNLENYFTKREENIEKIKKYNKKYYQENRDKILKYYQDNKDELSKNVDKENRKKWHRNRYNSRKNDPMFKLNESIRSSIRKIFNNRKPKKTNDILGCSYNEFKIYIESKFENWMSWNNYGLYNGELSYGWDIDHIIPSSSAKTEEELIKLNHYTNLQPLCSKINRDVKRNKMDY